MKNFIRHIKNYFKFISVVFIACSCVRNDAPINNHSDDVIINTEINLEHAELNIESTKAEVETPEFYYPYTGRLSNLSQSIFLILGLILPLGLKTKKVGG